MKHCRKYNNVGVIHWVVDKEVDLEEGLHVYETDFDIQDMVITARHNRDEVELYYDHKVDIASEEHDDIDGDEDVDADVRVGREWCSTKVISHILYN